MSRRVVTCLHCRGTVWKGDEAKKFSNVHSSCEEEYDAYLSRQELKAEYTKKTVEENLQNIADDFLGNY